MSLYKTAFEINKCEENGYKNHNYLSQGKVKCCAAQIVGDLSPVSMREIFFPISSDSGIAVSHYKPKKFAALIFIYVLFHCILPYL